MYQHNYRYFKTGCLKIRIFSVSFYPFDLSKMGDFRITHPIMYQCTYVLHDVLKFNPRVVGRPCIIEFHTQDNYVNKPSPVVVLTRPSLEMNRKRH